MTNHAGNNHFRVEASLQNLLLPTVHVKAVV